MAKENTEVLEAKVIKKAKAQKKIAYTGEGSKDGYFYLKKGDPIPNFMLKDPKYKVAISLWFE